VRVEFVPDRTRLQLVSCSEDNTIRVWDLKTQKALATFKDHFRYTRVHATHFSHLARLSVSSIPPRALICSFTSWCTCRRTAQRSNLLRVLSRRLDHAVWRSRPGHQCVEPAHHDAAKDGAGV
jgi:WD40 repeat protein